MRIKDSRGSTFHSLPVEFKATDIDEKGRFSGYASVFGVMDAYREIVAPGAFKQSIRAVKAARKVLPALWQHNAAEPIGGYDKLEEDEKGLHVEGFLMIDEIARAKEVRSLMQRGIVTGLSIGYYVLDDSWNEKDRVRTLKKLDLVEVSAVTFPANPEAQIDAVKQKLLRAHTITVREFEQLLREQGFTRAKAEEIAQRGFKESEGDSGEPRRSTAQHHQLLNSGADEWLRILGGRT